VKREKTGRGLHLTRNGTISLYTKFPDGSENLRLSDEDIDAVDWYNPMEDQSMKEDATSPPQQPVDSIATSNETVEVENKNCVPAVKLCTPVSASTLRGACDEASDYGIKFDCLEQLFGDLEYLGLKVDKLKDIEDAFMSTIEAFRKINHAFIEVDGQVRVFVSLCQSLQILGFEYPDPDDNDDDDPDVPFDKFSKAMRCFCEKFGFEEDVVLLMGGCDDYYVPAEIVFNIIEEAQLPSKIAQCLTNWFTAFIAERIAVAPLYERKQKDWEYFL